MVSAISYASVAAASAVVLLSSGAEAHQRVTIPAPTYTNNDRNVNWNPLAFLENQGTTVGADALKFLKSKGAKTLRDFMDNKANYKIEAAGASFECGYTNPNGKRQSVPSNGMMRSTGYTHEGPCEIWIDNTMVKHGDNCHFDIGAGATSYKIDWSSCKGNCMLRWYWFGNRLIGGKKRSWQVYKACIPIKGNGGAREMNVTDDDDEYLGAEAETPAEEEAPTPVPTPVPTPEAEEEVSGAEGDPTEAAITGPDAYGDAAEEEVPGADAGADVDADAAEPQREIVLEEDAFDDEAAADADAHMPEPTADEDNAADDEDQRN